MRREASNALLPSLAGCAVSLDLKEENEQRNGNPFGFLLLELEGLLLPVPVES